MEGNKMGYNTNNDGHKKGQWSKKNNSSAAHGGLRHKALFGSVDKQAPPANSAAQYGEKPSDWQNGPIAPPSVVSDPKAIHSTKVQGQRNKTPSDPYGRTTNTAYEQTRRLDGRDKFHDRWTRATDVTEQAPEFRQLQEALPKVAEGLRADIEEARASKGRRPEWLKSLVHLDPYSLAYIGLHTCYNDILFLGSLTSDLF